MQLEVPNDPNYQSFRLFGKDVAIDGDAISVLTERRRRTSCQTPGYSLALDQYGRVLAVGSPYDASKATGIDGDREDASVPDRGAVWLY